MFHLNAFIAKNKQCLHIKPFNAVLSLSSSDYNAVGSQNTIAYFDFTRQMAVIHNFRYKDVGEVIQPCWRHHADLPLFNRGVLPLFHVYWLLWTCSLFDHQPVYNESSTLLFADHSQWQKLTRCRETLCFVTAGYGPLLSTRHLMIGATSNMTRLGCRERFFNDVRFGVI